MKNTNDKQTEFHLYELPIFAAAMLFYLAKGMVLWVPRMVWALIKIKTYKDE